MKRGFEETSFVQAMLPQSVAGGKETACDFVDAAGTEEVMFLVVCAALDEGKKLKAALYAGENADGTGSKLVQEAEFAAEQTRGKTVVVLSYRPAPYTGRYVGVKFQHDNTAAVLCAVLAGVRGQRKPAQPQESMDILAV